MKVKKEEINTKIVKKVDFKMKHKSRKKNDASIHCRYRKRAEYGKSIERERNHRGREGGREGRNSED